ncbi:hypothetical protein TrVE_jg13878 [Triparma verrucosa]|uniref:Uncharacterized protein n=2 Tax=Triparma TaxID=722752 RepID=A0A9W7F0I6_9STRA|nr:hypothetical protein TrVE_jg13878 [Triparma verrucosa]GMH97142.1 hypothetical protein TrST_g5392 [Triparma strigata]
MAKDLSLFYAELWVVVHRLSHTGYHFITVFLHLLILSQLVPVALNPWIPAIPPLLGAAIPFDLFWPTLFPAYELSYKEWIWVLLKDHVKVDLAVVSVQKAAGLSAIGYVGSVVNKFLPEPKDADFDFMTTTGAKVDLDGEWYSSSFRARFLTTLSTVSKLFVAFYCLPHAVASRTLPDTLLPFFWIATILTSTCSVLQATYDCFMAAESIFINPPVVKAKIFAGLYLEAIAASQEAIFVFFCLFGEKRPEFSVSLPQMAAAWLLLFYYLPACTYLHFESGYEAYENTKLHWGVISDDKAKEIDNMLIKADPAYQKWEKKARVEAQRLRMGIGAKAANKPKTE